MTDEAGSEIRDTRTLPADFDEPRDLFDERKRAPRKIRYKTRMLTSDEVDDSIPAHVSTRLAWLSIVGFWALYYLITTISRALEAEPQQLQLMVRRAAVTLCGIGLTGLLRLLLLRLEDRSLVTLVTTAFLAAIPLSTGYASANFIAFYVIYPHASDMHEIHERTYGAIAIIADTASSWYFFVVAWAILYIALAYAVKVRHAERTAARYRMEAQTAQLRALRYQVNPHFLFNTLNSLSTLVLRKRNEEAERMILNLSTFFRSTLATEIDDEIPLADEIRMQQLYLDIEQVRFPDRLKVEIDVTPELQGALVPAMLLQPLVENAIKHGVAHSAAPVTLTLCARPKPPDSLWILVVDDARPANDRSEAAPRRKHVGLRNVCARLEGRYGNASSCHYGVRPEGGFQVTLALPLKHRE